MGNNKILVVLFCIFALYGCATDYYYGEMPSKYLINEQGQYIDEKGNVLKNGEKVVNPHYKKYIDAWGDVDKIPYKVIKPNKQKK